MSFQDIFKSNFIDNITAISAFDAVVTLGLAFVIGLVIFFIYKRTYAGVMYSQSFGITLIGLTMITSMLILAVTSNVVLSLGMVGALSIVRFRTAIKEPSDIVFLFWSISVGIILAAGFYPLAILGSIAIGSMLLIFNRTNTYDKPFILVVHCDKLAEKKIVDVLSRNAKRFSLKSKTVTSQQVEINFEVRLKNEDTEFINKIYEMEGVNQAILVAYNGEYMV